MKMNYQSNKNLSLTITLWLWLEFKFVIYFHFNKCFLISFPPLIRFKTMYLPPDMQIQPNINRSNTRYHLHRWRAYHWSTMVVKFFDCCLLTQHLRNADFIKFNMQSAIRKLSLMYSSIHVSLDPSQENIYSVKEEDGCHANELRLHCERGTKH